VPEKLLPDQTATVMLRTVTSGRPAAHRRSVRWAF